MIASDTICAPATAPGGAIAVIRISGPDALSAASSVCSSITATTTANTTHFARIKDGDEIIDEAMVSVFRAPHSYTGEDSVEISCHGSRYIINKVLELLVGHGCRMARPGEFTQRAYLNGKMDLSQAEAVADLIASTNRASHQMAMSQLRGHFSSELASLRDQLLHLTTLLELELDFSDHEELEFADRTELIRIAQKIDNHITNLARSFEMGQALKLGIPVTIVGKTNVGKSTLLNQLLHEDRAIVSDIHGTTRDTIEDTIDIRGVQFRIIDTAGLRQTTDEIEQIGIERTHQAIEKARIVLWLFDQEPTTEESLSMQSLCKGKSLIIIRNKTDLFPTTGQTVADISISAKHGTNIQALEDIILQSIDLSTLNDSDFIVTNTRHYEALNNAHAHLARVLDALATQLPADLIAEDLRLVLSTLGEITGGTITSQETLNNIFSNFCIGK